MKAIMLSGSALVISPRAIAKITKMHITEIVICGEITGENGFSRVYAEHYSIPIKKLKLQHPFEGADIESMDKEVRADIEVSFLVDYADCVIVLTRDLEAISIINEARKRLLNIYDFTAIEVDQDGKE